MSNELPSRTRPEEPMLWFNGLDGRCGGYLMPPVPPRQLADFALGTRTDPARVRPRACFFAPANPGDPGKPYPPPPALAAPIVDKEGFMSLSTDAVVKHFASDLPASEARVVAATQVPIAVSAFSAQVSGVAWKTKPSWYIVSKLDGAIAPDEERFFAKRMKATTTELNSIHVSMLSQPKAAAAVILDAAAKALSATPPPRTETAGPRTALGVPGSEATGGRTPPAPPG